MKYDKPKILISYQTKFLWLGLNQKTLGGELRTYGRQNGKTVRGTFFLLRAAVPLKVRYLAEHSKKHRVREKNAKRAIQIVSKLYYCADGVAELWDEIILGGRDEV